MFRRNPSVAPTTRPRKQCQDHHFDGYAHRRCLCGDVSEQDATSDQRLFAAELKDTIICMGGFLFGSCPRR